MAEHGISDPELETIRAVLAECDDEITQVDLFGSRATGKHRSHSDIDLVIYGAVREAAIDRLRTLFIESNLPVSVDILSYDGITCLPLKEHVDAVRQRLFTAQDIQGSGDRSMRDRRGSAIVEFMTANLKPYPNMKDSGVEALEQVPAHWDVMRLRNVTEMRVSNVDKHSRQKEAQVNLCNYVDVYKNDRIRPGMPFMRATATADEIERFGLRSGDVLITKDSEVWNDIGVPALVEGTEETSPRVVSGYHLALLRPYSERTHSGYLFRSLQSTAISSQLHVQANGVTRFGLTRGAIKAVRMPLPPLHEQAAIVRFLDHTDRLIQRYIHARQKLIALLAEQKQAIIHQAVTGKIDVRTGKSYPAYKSSGVECLGSVPRHWDVSQLRRVAIDRCDGPFGSGLKSSHYTIDGIRVVRLQNIGHGEFIDADTSFISLDHYATLGDHSVVPGDVLIAGLGDGKHPSGRACVAPEALGNAMVKADCFRFRLNRTQVEPRFVATQLTATASVASAVLSRGATRQRTNLENMSARKIGIPLLDEQASIMDYLEERTHEIRAAHDSAKRELILLNEYRARLIEEVVTGRVDVREAASTMGGD